MILALVLISLYVLVLSLSVVHLAQSPSLEPSSHQFDLRLNYGDHTMLVAAKPSIVIEAQYPIGNDKLRDYVMGEYGEKVTLSYLRLA